MKKTIKCFGVVLICFLLVVVSLPFSASAEGGTVAIVYQDGDPSGEGTEYSDLQDAFQNANEGSYVKLMSDVTIPSFIYDDENFVYYGLELGFTGVFDLNGHQIQITYSLPEDFSEELGFVAALHAFTEKMDTLVIKNGIIKLISPASSSSDIGLSFAILTEGRPNFTFENMELYADDNVPITYGIADAYKQGGFSPMNFQIKNSIIKLGSNVPAVISGSQLMLDLFDSDEPKLDDKVFISGDYQCLSGKYTDGIFTFEEEDKVTIAGVENSTIIKSDTTTAIIVQDGNAYLYDTLQEAVDAAAKRATTGTDDKKKAEILVLKTPESETSITLPEEFDGIQVSVTSQSGVSLDGVQFTGNNGKTYVIGKDGILTVKEPDPDPVPPPVVVPSEPTYRPTITQTENGTVSTSPSYPEKDDKVTITATPEEGYKVGTVTVVDKNGNPVQVSSEGNGKYSYQQPEGSVTITVDFVWDNPFSDVKEGAWYYEAVQYVQLHGLMEGLPGNVFGPNKELTRAEVVQILYNLEGKPAVTGESTFTDVDGHWAVAPITWADQNKVIGGYGDGTFLPDKPVSREEFAQMMYNYTIFKKLDASATADLTKFPDGTDVANWAETAMEWANGNELINGHEDGTLDPQGTANRAQAASILMRFDQNLVNG